LSDKKHARHTARDNKAINVAEDTANALFEKTFHVGKCVCDGDLIAYIPSEPQNAYNVYCLGCGSISDARFPKGGDQYYWSKVEILKAIATARREAELEVPDPLVAEISAVVNAVHGKAKKDG
jgi:hypothetical protein